MLNDYDTNASLINQAIGLFLFPWVILIQFGKFNPIFLLSSALVILATGFFIKWYRGVLLSMVEQKMNIFIFLTDRLTFYYELPYKFSETIITIFFVIKAIL